MYDALYQIFEQVIVPTVVALGGGFAGWFFARRRNRAEAKTVEIGNLDKIIEMWQETAEHYKTMSRELMEHNRIINEELNEMRSRNESMAKDLEKLKATVEHLSRENKKLVGRLKELEKHYEETEQ